MILVKTKSEPDIKMIHFYKSKFFIEEKVNVFVSLGLIENSRDKNDKLLF